MRDARVAQLAGRQFNRVSRDQLAALGLSNSAIAHRVAAGRLVTVEEGVFAVTRPGCGGPRRHGGVRAFRSSTLEGECTVLRGIPITSVSRTLLDLARGVSDRALARSVREAVRLELVTIHALGDTLGRCRGRRGARRLADTIARYTGLPLERARSGAEIRALEILRSARRALPKLNQRIAGEEADLSWVASRLIIEIDGQPFHLDAGEDARKQARWEAAGWRVTRIPAEDVYERPGRLLGLAPASSVPERVR